MRLVAAPPADPRLQDAVNEYAQRGWTPIPLNGKKPVGTAWQKQTATEGVAAYRPGQNVGVLLDASGLVDVDGDCAAAVFAMRHWMPDTPAMFGRGAADSGHFIYSGTTDKKAFTSPGVRAEDAGLIELRSGPHQTMFPPSMHPDTKALLRWQDRTGVPMADQSTPTPASVDADALLRAVTKCALFAHLSTVLGPAQRHDNMLSIAGGLARAGWEQDAAVEFVRVLCEFTGQMDVHNRLAGVRTTYERHGNHERVAGFAALEEQANVTKPWCRAAGKWAESSIEQPEAASDGRHEIPLVGGELHVATKAVIATLAAAGGIYDRGGQLSRVIEMHEARASGLRLPGELTHAGTSGIARDDAQAIVVPITADYLRLRSSSLMQFTKVDARKNRIPVDCPRDLALSVLAASGSWTGIPPLRSIARAPFFRSDGTICSTIGYDAGTATLLVPCGEPLPPIADAPTHDDAVDALATLRAPFSEVTWENPTHESALLAFIFTLIARNLVPTAPAAIFTSPIAGAGKSLLLECAATIVYGHKPALRPYPSEFDEMRKVLHSASLAGDPLVAFDNLPNGAAVGDATLNAYLTGEVMADRTLGVSESPRLVNTSCYAFTGVNIGAKADSVRRFLRISIDPDCEHPEAREFVIKDLVGHCREHRPQLLHAVLTMLRAFFVAGAPVITARSALGSYSAWDRIAAGCCVWLDLPDPVSTQAELIADDPDAQAATALFHALLHQFPSTFRFAEVSRAIEQAPGGPLAGAINVTCRDGIKSLSRWLRAHANQHRGGMKLVRDGMTDGTTRYRVVDQTGEAAKRRLPSTTPPDPDY